MMNDENKTDKMEPEAGDKKPPDQPKVDRRVEEGIHNVKVNGIDIPVQGEKVVALDILKFAKEKGAIPGNPENYTLHGEKGEYAPKDSVNLSDDNVFITVPNTPTQVA